MGGRLSVVLAALFPFTLWLGGFSHPGLVAFYLFLIAVCRWLASGRKLTSAADAILTLAPAVIAILVLLLGSDIGLYYPVLISLGLLALFGASLGADRSAIQVMAERMEGRSLDTLGIRYTRYLTMVWCSFFTFNALVATGLTLSGDLRWWTIYNGVISYLLVAVLFLGERLLRDPIRRSMLRREERQSND